MFPFLTNLMPSFSSALLIHWIKSVSNILMVCSSVPHLPHRFSISDDVWRAWVSFSLTDFYSFSNFKYSSYFILADPEAFIIDESMMIAYGFRLFASIWFLIIHLEIIVLGDMLTWKRSLFWLKLCSTDAWPWSQC